MIICLTWVPQLCRRMIMNCCGTLLHFRYVIVFVRTVQWPWSGNHNGKSENTTTKQKIAPRDHRRTVLVNDNVQETVIYTQRLGWVHMIHNISFIQWNLVYKMSLDSAEISNNNILLVCFRRPSSVKKLWENKHVTQYLSVMELEVWYLLLQWSLQAEQQQEEQHGSQWNIQGEQLVHQPGVSRVKQQKK